MQWNIVFQANLCRYRIGFKKVSVSVQRQIEFFSKPIDQVITRGFHLFDISGHHRMSEEFYGYVDRLMWMSMMKQGQPLQIIFIHVKFIHVKFKMNFEPAKGVNFRGANRVVKLNHHRQTIQQIQTNNVPQFRNQLSSV